MQQYRGHYKNFSLVPYILSNSLNTTITAIAASFTAYKKKQTIKNYVLKKDYSYQCTFTCEAEGLTL